MTKQLYKHQVKFSKGHKDKDILVHEMGTGKTVSACVWLKDGRDSDALVICPLQIKDKWREALDEWGTKAIVVSKEEFKKLHVKRWSAIVVDEADMFASPLFTKGRSQLSTALYEQIKAYDAPILLLTATPIRSRPENLHTLLCFLGIYYDWKEWRARFMSLERRPFLPYPAWLPKSGWRKDIRQVLEKHADIVLLRDCVEDLPPITEHVLQVPCSAFKDNPEWSPMASFVALHRHEQENKAEEIINIGKGYRKVLVVAHYVEQIKTLDEQLSKDKQTFIVHGSVQNQEEILQQANKADECYLIIQASIGAGFDADSFSCVVFASMSYRARDFVQMKGRVRRIHNLHPVVYYYLIGGRADKQVYKQVMLGRDFIPSEWSINSPTSQNLDDTKRQTSLPM